MGGIYFSLIGGWYLLLLDQLQQAQADGQPYRLMLTDVQMPEADGFSLVEQIHSDPRIPPPAIVMLTSGDQTEDLARCQELGIAAFLIKPVKPPSRARTI